MRRIDVERCAWCGIAHKKLQLIELLFPNGPFLFWATCPTVEQPILVSIHGGHVATQAWGPKANIIHVELAHQLAERKSGV